ncbi:MAG: GNAT family N-acetyltransferase [Paludibacteraceae bacterium]|nr:GNAT family N-acetyltransferase [Paludibacteraceae bacterium]
MQTLSRQQFYDLISEWAIVPHTQTDAWCRGQIAESELRYYADDSATPTIACAGYVRRKAGLSMLCIQGECRREETADESVVSEFYLQLTATGYDAYELNLNSLYTPECETALRLGGWLRPVGLFSTTLSKEIDLTRAVEYDHNWKKNLKKAARYPLTFFAPDHADEQDIRDYMTLHREMVERKQFNGYLSEPLLRRLMDDPSFKMLLVKGDDCRPVAATVIHISPRHTATSLYAVTSPRGRELSASYYLYERMLAHLSEKGVTTFDMGRLAPSRHSKNSVFTFKNGLKGKMVSYNGEWQWCRRKWMPLALYLLKKYVWKRTQV